MSPGRLIYIARFYSARGLRYWIAEKKLAPKITNWHLPEDLPEEVQPTPIHTLTGARDWRMALWMLASLHHTTRRRWRVVVHEDGTLPDHAAKTFLRLFPGNTTIVTRKQADQSMAAALAPFPRCVEYRARMPHGLKCFDIPFLSTAERFLLIDPDVLFFSRPSEILNWVDNPDDHSCWFNRDFQEPSPLPPAEARKALSVDLWPHVNSGLCLLDKNAIQLAKMEHWLAQPALQDPNVQWRVEQTLLALSASDAATGGILPISYEVSPNKHRQPGCVARHYVGYVRDHFYREGISFLAPTILRSRANAK